VTRVDLIAYYDGSGKVDDSAFVTLAGIAAPEQLWPRFNALWKVALKKHHLLWWHTANAMQSKPKQAQLVEAEYRDAWSEEKAHAAFTDLSGLIYSFVGNEHNNGFQVLSCTVDMAGYRAAKVSNPWLRAVEAICVNTCVGNLALHESGAFIRLYFDENESFRKYIDQVWLRTKKRQDAHWPRQIRLIETAKDSDVCALQAADLIAWDRNQTWRTIPDEIPRFSVFGLTWRYYDQKAIEEAYPLDKERGRIKRHRDAGLKTAETQRKNPDERS
jgi:hypothetical protein